jgi:hypothetical protein
VQYNRAATAEEGEGEEGDEGFQKPSEVSFLFWLLLSLWTVVALGGWMLC